MFAGEQKTSCDVSEFDYLMVPHELEISSSGYDRIKKLYERDRQMCRDTYTDKKELGACYIGLKRHYECILSNTVNFDRQINSLDDIEYHLRFRH